MKKILAIMLLIVLIVLPTAAMAEVVVRVNNGKSTNYRSDPNLDGEVLGSLKSKEEALFAEETSTDDRGVIWYRIWVDQTEEKMAWVSSKYTTLTDGEFDGLIYNADLVGTMKVLSDDTLAVDPYKAVGSFDLPKGYEVYGMGYCVVVDGEHTWVMVGNGEGETGWLDTLNVKMVEEDEAVELQ